MTQPANPALKKSLMDVPVRVDVVLGEMLHRCRALRLRAVGAERELLVNLAILVSARSVEYVHRTRGRDWHAM